MSLEKIVSVEKILYVEKILSRRRIQVRYMYTDNKTTRILVLVFVDQLYRVF